MNSSSLDTLVIDELLEEIAILKEKIAKQKEVIKSLSDENLELLKEIKEGEGGKN